MKVSIQLHIIKSGWSILIYLGFTVNNFQSILYYFSEDGFCLSYSAGPDEMQHRVFYPGLQGLSQHPFKMG